MYVSQQERVFARRSYLRDSVASLSALAPDAASNAYPKYNNGLSRSAAFEQRQAVPNFVRGLATITLLKRGTNAARARPRLKRPANRPFMPANL
jgi:hypothetical protein